MPRSKRVRKPRQVYLESRRYSWTLAASGKWVRIGPLLLNPEQTERLAAWLLKAAKWVRAERRKT